VRQVVDELRPRLITHQSADGQARLPSSSSSSPEMTIHLDRTDLVPALNSLRDALGDTCEHALDEAELEADEVDAIFATGGMSAYPQVVQRIAEAFGQDVNHDGNLDHHVVLGAAYEAAIITQRTEGPLVLDGMSTGNLSLAALNQ
jgi:molecular chaperone DnaK (HSP70)